jgi:transposase
MKASHGGKAKHDRIDAHTMAVWLRGGMRPQASVDPAALRATRDRLRRRLHLLRQRAELLAHIHHTTSPSHLPASGKQLDYKAHREGVAERFLEPAVHTSMEVDLTRIGQYDRRLTDVARDRVQTAKAHEAQTFYRRRSIPGVGKILALVRRYEIHDLPRLPRVPECVSSGRLVQGAQESAGTRYGTSGTKIGTADLTWAFSDAAVLCLRNHPAGQQYLARVVQKHGQGNALTVLAHQWARAVYDLCTRDTAFDLDKCLPASGSGAGTPAASRAAEGLSLTSECWQP